MPQIVEPNAWREVKQKPKYETKWECSRAGDTNLQSYLVLGSQRRQNLTTMRLSRSHLWSLSNRCCINLDIYIVSGRLAEIQAQKGRYIPSSPVLKLCNNMLGLVLKSSKSLGPNYSALGDQVKWLSLGPTSLTKGRSCSSWIWQRSSLLREL